MQFRCLPRTALLCAALAACARSSGEVSPMVPLKAEGEAFVDDKGESVRLWGVNLVSPFPSHEEAEHIAANLAERQINLVRPHHLLRPSSDWIYRAKVLGLSLMRENTRDPDPEAWDRFDYLNAQLRKHGIYLSLSLHFSRSFMEGDADVLKTTPEDRAAWMAAVRELRSWVWQKSMDPMKALPTLDARCRALQEEFARQLLGHRNPYTGLAYGQDPQVLTIEVVNESSVEYCLICGNTFPGYFLDGLSAKWAVFLKGRAAEPFDLRKAKSDDEKKMRAEFYRSLDEDLLKGMTRVVRDTGCRAALTYSNLWRGENNLAMHQTHADFIENHAYVDPLVVREPRDAFAEINRTLLRGKPFIIGELNHAEGEANKHKLAHLRTMLPLAISSYGAFNRYAGIVWFAWSHGDRATAANGWAVSEDRDSHVGDMVSDGMMLDHLRTCGLIFRKGLVAPSREPQTLYVDAPFLGTDYSSLMKAKYEVKPGWQNVHAYRKAFGPVPAAQAAADFMTSAPPQPLVSDTGEIVKDVSRQQLTVSAAQAEAFSGHLDGAPPAKLARLLLKGSNTFSTVVAVCLDGRPFAETGAVLISRTCVDSNRCETLGPDIALSGLAPAGDGQAWCIRLTRPRQVKTILEDFTGQRHWKLQTDSEGRLTLPRADWHECEVRLCPNAIDATAPLK